MAEQIDHWETPLLQKVFTDCLGDFSWCLFVDPEVVKSWEFLRFRAGEYLCKSLHCQFYVWEIAFPARHQQNARRYFSIVCIASIKASYFSVFAQVFVQKLEHVLSLVRADEKR